MNFDTYFARKDGRSKNKKLVIGCQEIVNRLISTEKVLTDFDIKNVLQQFWVYSHASKKRQALPDLTPQLIEKFTKEIKEKRAKIKLKQRNKDNPQPDGLLYLLENEMYPGWIKCGITTNIQSRIKSYNGYDPLKRFSLIICKEVTHRREAEKALIFNLNMKSDIQSGEWFRIDRDTALKEYEIIVNRYMAHLVTVEA